jgi:general secretion pathway protein M
MGTKQHTRGHGWAMAILAAIVVVLLIAVVAPVTLSFAEQSDEVAQSRDQLADYRAQIASRPVLEARLAAIDKQDASTAGLLRGDSTALAAANMQGLVTALLHRHGGQVRSMQNLPSSFTGGLEKIDVQFELSVPLASLKSVIYQLETGLPFLYIDQMAIHPEEDAALDGPMSAPRDLHVELLVHGYRWAATR